MLAKDPPSKKDKLGYVDIVKVMLIKDSGSPYRIKKISGPRDVADIARDFLADQDREVFIVLNLDGSGRINSINVVGIGSATEAIVHPREIFKTAILSNAVGIVIAHNHPSGNPNPSDDDLQITRKLTEAGEILGIKVLDHIIIGDDQYSSSTGLDGKPATELDSWITRNFKGERDQAKLQKEATKEIEHATQPRRHSRQKGSL
jgi:DNA repair protein RadC